MKLLDKLMMELGSDKTDWTLSEAVASIKESQTISYKDGILKGLSTVIDDTETIKNLESKISTGDRAYINHVLHLFSQRFLSFKTFRKPNSFVEFLKKNGIKPILRHYWKTLVHKWDVFRGLATFAGALLWRGIIHDNSKFGWEETRYFALAKDARHLKYGSPEYAAQTEMLRPGIELHYKNNSHHPQYHANGIKDMSILDKIEMIADWRAAGKRNKGGNLLDSIAKNQERFDYNVETLELFHGIAYTIGGIDKVYNT